MVYDVQKPFKGIIVDRDVDIYENKKSNWFKPSLLEVQASERVLVDQLSQLNTGKANQQGPCPDIEKNLKKYVRQYVGYYDQEGNKIILINMLWGKEVTYAERLREEYWVILDGCSYYWRVKVDLGKEKLFDLDINGSA